MAAEKFGRYVIKSEIGRGGMATVFHAYDPRFERDVAIKVLPKEFLHDPQFRTRFEREAKTIALLEHPAIVPVYDFGEEEGQPYIVMRYMSGGSMAERLEKGAFSVEDTLQIFLRLAPALDAAHARGIIHRDLKPGNILFDQYDNAFLSDFGIARLAQSGVATLTGGSILGTPAYMSPEQVQGDKEIDGRSDIYSMGIILYQMLTGHTPYQATTPARVMMMHILEPVPQISQNRTDLPANLQLVLNKAMAKNPDERYSTLAEMAADLSSLFAVSTPPRPISQTTPLPSPATIVSPQPDVLETVQKTKIDERGVKTVIGPQPAAAAPARKAAMGMGWLVAALAIVMALGALGLGGWFVASSGILNRSTPTSLPLPTFTQLAVLLPTNTEKPVEPTFTPEPATATLPPSTDTPLPPSTDTPPPPATPTDTAPPPPVALVVGGADKIAFINENEIWTVNIDGSDLQQLTSDGAAKFRPQWLPDGENIIFLTGKCIKMVNVATRRVDLITCFETAAYLEDFAVSPDGKLVAISLDHEHLYIVPFNLDALKAAKKRGDLAPMGACKEFSPFDEVFVKTVRWSSDSQKVALVFSAPVGGRREDNIRVLDITICSEPERRVGVDFPANFFTISGYNTNPVLNNFGWDGESLFALNGSIRNGGFGDLYFFNLENNRPDLQVNPINRTCCYRDPQYSPDGRYLIFAYQEFAQTNKISLYYIPLGTIGTGEKYTPIPLPDNFFPNRTDSPQPTLRRAK